MTVKEVFDLRKQGKIEEAYEAIRPMYAVHQGKYTTLCMFWTASDILKKRIKEQRFDEAEKIFKALLRVLPNIEDRSAQSDAYSSKASLKKDGKARSSILYEAVTLDKEIKAFSMLDFLSQLQALPARCSRCSSDSLAYSPQPMLTSRRSTRRWRRNSCSIGVA